MVGSQRERDRAAAAGRRRGRSASAVLRPAMFESAEHKLAARDMRRVRACRGTMVMGAAGVVEMARVAAVVAVPTRGLTQERMVTQVRRGERASDELAMTRTTSGRQRELERATVMMRGPACGTVPGVPDGTRKRGGCVARWRDRRESVARTLRVMV